MAGSRFVSFDGYWTPAGHTLGHSLPDADVCLVAHVTLKTIVAGKKATEQDLGEESDDHERN